MIEHLQTGAGIVIAAALAADALLHLYWAMGRMWPASDLPALSRAVLNSDRTPLFRPGPLVRLACLLFAGALIALARVHLLGAIGRLLPDGLWSAGVWALAAGFLAVGGAGIVRALGFVKIKSELYRKLNVRLYIPACAVLFAAALLIAE